LTNRKKREKKKGKKGKGPSPALCRQTKGIKGKRKGMLLHVTRKKPGRGEKKKKTLALLFMLRPLNKEEKKKRKRGKGRRARIEMLVIACVAGRVKKRASGKGGGKKTRGGVLPSTPWWSGDVEKKERGRGKKREKKEKGDQRCFSGPNQFPRTDGKDALFQ